MEIAPPLGKTNSEYFRKRRLRPGQAEYPRRIVVSGSGTLNPAVKDFSKSIFTSHCADHQARGWENFITALRPGGRGENLWRTQDPFPRHIPSAAGKMERETSFVHRRQQAKPCATPRPPGDETHLTSAEYFR
jgi:hypothetical protein